MARAQQESSSEVDDAPSGDRLRHLATRHAELTRLCAEQFEVLSPARSKLNELQRQLAGMWTRARDEYEWGGGRKGRGGVGGEIQN